VSGGLGNIYVAALHQLRHLAGKKKRHNNLRYVRAVHVSIGHNHDAVIPSFSMLNVSSLHRAEAVPTAVIICCEFRYVENLSTAPSDVQQFAQSAARLELPVAALFGRTTGGVALDDVEFAQSSGFFSEQSASFARQGSTRSAPLRTASRACEPASRARAAVSDLSTMRRPTGGFCSRKVERPSYTMELTNLRLRRAELRLGRAPQLRGRHF